MSSLAYDQAVLAKDWGVLSEMSLRAAADIAFRSVSSLNEIYENAHAVFDKRCSPNAESRRRDSDAVESRSGKCRT